MTAARSFLAVCGALCGFALGYALPSAARLPVPLYAPLAHRWSFAPPPGSTVITYFGQLGYGVLGALAGGGLAWLLGRLGRAGDPGGRALAGAWALTALALVGAYFTWLNWP